MCMIPHDISSSGGEVHCTSNKERVGHDHQADDSWKLQGGEEWWRNCFQHFYSQRLVWGGRWVRTGVSTWQSSGLSPHSLLSNLQHQLLLTRLWHQRPLQTRKGADSQVSGGGYCKDDLTDPTERAWAVQRSGAACQVRALRPVDSSSAPWRTWHYVHTVSVDSWYYWHLSVQSCTTATRTTAPSAGPCCPTGLGRRGPGQTPSTPASGGAGAGRGWALSTTRSQSNRSTSASSGGDGQFVKEVTASVWAGGPSGATGFSTIPMGDWCSRERCGVTRYWRVSPSSSVLRDNERLSSILGKVYLESDEQPIQFNSKSEEKSRFDHVKHLQKYIDNWLTLTNVMAFTFIILPN